MNDKEIVRLASRAQIDPQSLTTEEIRSLGFVVLCDLNDSGEMLRGKVEVDPPRRPPDPGVGIGISGKTSIAAFAFAITVFLIALILESKFMP